MIRVVLDTNLLFSAVLKPATVPAAVFDLVTANKLLMCVSEEVLAEYHEVLLRPVLAPHRQRAEQVLELISGIALKVSPAETIRACKDPDDDCFLECAEAANAEYLVTGNVKHIPQSPWRITQIVTARELLNIIASLP
jgi:putative PIN family toxin of toxin-antitoxin system